MNIWDTPERDQLRKTTRSFAEREILPHADEWGRTVAAIQVNRDITEWKRLREQAPLSRS